MGVDDDYGTAQDQRPVFGPASSSFQLPFHCIDLSVTSEGRLLLAAGEQGMREYDLSGLELSSWTPAKPSNGKDDFVSTVAALDDGRASVSLLQSKLIVLLRRTSADKAWLVDTRVAELQSPAWQVSVQGDLAAVALCKLDGHCWPGPQLQLMRLSTGEVLNKEKRQYNIHTVALTAEALITTSANHVTLGDGRQADVVDCSNHRGERLWRHELRNDESVGGVCVAATGQLHVAVYGAGSKRSKDCVRIIGGEDGKKQCLALANSSLGGKQPVRVSLSRGLQQQQFLAVLSRDEALKKWNTVTVHPALSG